MEVRADAARQRDGKCKSVGPTTVPAKALDHIGPAPYTPAIGKPIGPSDGYRVRSYQAELQADDSTAPKGIKE